MNIFFAEILGIGTPELIIILVILLLLFGAKKLPELSKSIGTSAKELKKGFSEDVKDEKETKNQNQNENRTA